MPDREKVLEALRHCLPATKEDGVLTCDTCPYYRCDDGVRISVALIEDIRNLLKEQPQIVHCGECKWWDKKGESPYGYCHACKHGYSSPNWEIGIYRMYKGDFFCADGERK